MRRRRIGKRLDQNGRAGGDQTNLPQKENPKDQEMTINPEINKDRR
jgi:hypothetical protein